MDQPSLKVFYHIFCHGNWREVVSEQLATMHAAGLEAICAGVIGGEADIAWVREQGLYVVATAAEPTAYEALTLNAMQQWCKANPGRFILYLHTKGVSIDPANAYATANRTGYRRLMMQRTVARWRDNLARVEREGADAIGVNVMGIWSGGCYWGNFEGNFYIGRSDWIAALPDILEHQEAHRER